MYKRQAPVLFRALRRGSSLVARGEESPAAVRSVMEQVVSGEPAVDLDYAAVVHADDLEPAGSCASERPLRLLIAAAVGPVRLIDNLDPHRVH